MLRDDPGLDSRLIQILKGNDSMIDSTRVLLMPNRILNTTHTPRENYVLALVHFSS